MPAQYLLEFTIGIIYRVLYFHFVHKVQTLVCKYGTACYTKLAFLVVEGYVYGRLSEVE